MARSGKRRLRAAFPDGVWEADVECRYPPGTRPRRVAEAARTEFEPAGVPEEELRRCLPEGPDGTRLGRVPRGGWAFRRTGRFGGPRDLKEEEADAGRVGRVIGRGVLRPVQAMTEGGPRWTATPSARGAAVRDLHAEVTERLLEALREGGEALIAASGAEIRRNAGRTGGVSRVE